MPPVAFVVMLLVAVPSIARADEHCDRLSQHTLDDLVDYDFEENHFSVHDLPDDARFGIGDVRIVRQPIFNPERPGEDHWLFRAMNAVHVQTREPAVRSALLFEPDEEVAVRVLAESERALRQKPFFYDARVLPRELCGDDLNIDVVVRDVWTLNPNLDFSRSGGENRFSIGFSDTNTFGTGKAVTLGIEDDELRRSTMFVYGDPNVLGSRHTLHLQIADQDDGERLELAAGLPFYSLDAGQTWGFEIGKWRRSEPLFFRGDEIAYFESNETYAHVYVGRSAGMRDGVTTRWLAGVDYEQFDFDELPDRPAPAPMPQDRRHVYPWIGFEHIDARYERAENVDRIQRTEDLFVGTRINGRFGYADDRLGSDDRRFFYGLSGEGGFRAGTAEPAPDAENEADPAHQDRHLIFYRAEFDGEYRLDRDRAENVRLTGTVQYRFNHAPRFSFSATATATLTRRLRRDQQLLLGGETGLRGYPNRYQVGDRSFLITLEERYFSDLYIARVLRVGAAIFLDVGRAWFPGDPSNNDFGVLANAGFGLRLESTRTRRDRVLHLDLAAPLHDGPNVRGLEITFTGKATL
jgi:hypothetical protein